MSHKFTTAVTSNFIRYTKAFTFCGQDLFPSAPQNALSRYENQSKTVFFFFKLYLVAPRPWHVERHQLCHNLQLVALGRLCGVGSRPVARGGGAAVQAWKPWGAEGGRDDEETLLLGPSSGPQHCVTKHDPVEVTVASRSQSNEANHLRVDRAVPETQCSLSYLRLRDCYL